MKRNILSCCALIFALSVPSAASAAPGSAAAGFASRIQARGSVTGTITYLSWSSFTIQTAGRQVGVVNALTTAANYVLSQDYPYVYGGGHEQAGIASIGIKGPGYNGRRVGYDCSGAVAAVLAGAGLWPAGSGVPNDAGIVSQLLRERLIAPGVGTGPVEVSLYDHPGFHIFMNIDGRFFGTSDGAGGGDSKGGAGWLDDGAPDASSPDFRRYHFVPSALSGSTSSGHIVSFQANRLQGLVGALQLGEKVRVTYVETGAGKMIASALAYPGAITASGTVGSVADDGSSLTIQTPDGKSLSLTTGGLTGLLDGVAIGDTVQVSYSKASYSKVHSTLIVHALKVTGTPPQPAAGSTGAPAGTTTSSSSSGS